MNPSINSLRQVFGIVICTLLQLHRFISQVKWVISQWHASNKSLESLYHSYLWCFLLTVLIHVTESIIFWEGQKMPTLTRMNIFSLLKEKFERKIRKKRIIKCQSKESSLPILKIVKLYLVYLNVSSVLYLN